MKQIGIAELKKLQIGILDVVATFCQEHNIRYWLDSGTLLGAIRHNGYIPWDDDIDIGMMRQDFDDFVHSFNNYHERYKVYCVETNHQYAFPYAKVMDNKTIMYEPDSKGIRHCVNIDVFVYDNAPDDDKEVEKMFIKRDILQLMNTTRTINSDVSTESKTKKYIISILRMVLRVFPFSYFAMKMSENSKKYKNCKTARIGNFTSYSKVVCEKAVFDSFVDHMFEGKLYKIPVGYDKWLRSFYGEYMELPPIEKRRSHHRFEAYMIEDNLGE